MAQGLGHAVTHPWLLLLLSCLAAAQDYTAFGPCGVVKITTPLQLPEGSECGSSCTLDVQIHIPVAGAGAGCSAAPYPVVLFFSGFQLSSTYYTPYVKRLASWGFAVVQYNIALFHIVADRVEVGFMPFLLRHLERHPDTAGVLDLTHLATAGHSRGGKLAALHLAGTPNILTAYLIDPVDSTSYTPPSQDDPSAVEALRGLNKTVAITGAGVSGPCNPIASNYKLFWDVVGPGSWLEVVPQGGHMQFTNISNGLVARALDLICHSGRATHVVTLIHESYCCILCTACSGALVKQCCRVLYGIFISYMQCWQTFHQCYQLQHRCQLVATSAAEGALFCLCRPKARTCSAVAQMQSSVTPSLPCCINRSM
eukprot:GHRR01019874.1.p1 GENE.GHRR01019874.1~~GHRR01019874.1.p1  ORF type:complete len:411 (+),score=59.16 GHRR01019874.1:128-1234(+)